MGPLPVIGILGAAAYFLVKDLFKQPAQACPVSEEERAWIEKTIGKLIALYGKERFLKTRTILPDYQGFPRQYVNSERFATRVFDEICAIMHIDPDHIDLEFGDTEMTPGERSDEYDSPIVPGSYTPEYDQLVTLDLDLIDGFDQLIAIAAHELSHVSLDRETVEEIDHSNTEYEPTIDMTAIFLGFGVFMARANSAYSISNGQTKLGYLSLPVICYAQAFISWKRGEDIAAWKEYVGKDVFTLMTTSLQAIQDAQQHCQEPPQQEAQHCPEPPQQGSKPSLDVEQLLHHSTAQAFSSISNQEFPQIEQMLQEARARHKTKDSS